jgi:hypothetical protein
MTVIAVDEDQARFTDGANSLPEQLELKQAADLKVSIINTLERAFGAGAKTAIAGFIGGRKGQRSISQQAGCREHQKEQKFAGKRKDVKSVTHTEFDCGQGQGFPIKG